MTEDTGAFRFKIFKRNSPLESSNLNFRMGDQFAG